MTFAELSRVARRAARLGAEDQTLAAELLARTEAFEGRICQSYGGRWPLLGIHAPNRMSKNARLQR